MSDFEIIKLVLGGLAFLLTWTGMVVGATRIIEKIKQDVTEKIAAESIERTKALSEAVKARDVELDAIRKEFGETGHALRRFIESVEKDMREIELWGRDNYVQKNEFEKAISSLEKTSDLIRSDVKDLISYIQKEFKELRDKMTKH